MLKHSFQLVLRHIISSRFYVFLNIIGLSTSILACLIIILWVRYETSFENFHEKRDRIFRFTTEFRNPNGYQSNFARCWQSWTRQMPSFFPDIEKMALFAPLRRTAVKMGDIKFYSEQVFQCNKETFDIFSFEIIQGSSTPQFNAPGNLLISENLFRTYFAGREIMDSTIELSGAFDTEFSKFRIAGVFKDFPSNSHFHPEILISMKDPGSFEGWAYTYFLLNDKSNAEKLLDQFPDFAENHLTEDEQKYTAPRLQPVSDIHLHSNKDREIEKNGSMNTIWIFISTGSVIFLLSLLNFINIQFALINRRKKHLVIQKILGSSFRQFSATLFLEIFIITLAASVISLMIYFLISPLLNEIMPSNKDMIYYSTLAISWTSLIFITLILSFIPLNLNILRPWLKISSFSGLNKNTDTVLIRESNLGIRRILVVFQFFISFTLITGTIFIQLQTEFLFNNSMKSETGPVMIIPEMNWSVKEKNQLLKQTLMSSAAITNVTASMEPPSGNIMDAMGFELQGYTNEDQDNSIYVFPVDDNFLDFFNIPLIAGNNFSTYDPEIKKEEYIINETALRHLGFNDPKEVIGRNFKLSFSIDSIFYGGTIKGVVKDFNLSPMHTQIKPLVMFQKPIWYGNMLVQLDPNRLQEGIRIVKESWDELFPEYYFDYRFSNELYDIVYENEIIQSELSRIFTFLALIIASLGLLGMSSLTNQIRSREISIRRVLGAFSTDIFLMLFRNYLYWIFIAILLAIPISWYITNKWAEQFAYRINFPWWIFFMSGILLFLIAFFSVGFQTFKAATKNPVESIRYE